MSTSSSRAGRAHLFPFTHTAAALGLAGAVLTLVVYAVSRRHRARLPLARAHLAVAGASFLVAAAVGIGPRVATLPGEAMCVLTGLLLQMADLFLVLLALYLLLGLALVVWRGWSSDAVAAWDVRAFQTMAVCAFGVSVPWAWFAKPMDGGSTFYGADAGGRQWCWISPHYAWLQRAILHVPAMAALLLTLLALPAAFALAFTGRNAIQKAWDGDDRARIRQLRTHLFSATALLALLSLTWIVDLIPSYLVPPSGIPGKPHPGRYTVVLTRVLVMPARGLLNLLAYLVMVQLLVPRARSAGPNQGDKAAAPANDPAIARQPSIQVGRNNSLGDFTAPGLIQRMASIAF